MTIIFALDRRCIREQISGASIALSARARFTGGVRPVSRKVNSLMSKLAQYLRDESGASAAEYALILALIAAAIITALTTLGTNIGKALNTVGNSINTAS